MIKLNNKNITYVALADSNNSLKAPKEIWYADSSNSVKLVYRRKDALIEGEDYEKYHWLVSDGDCYIDTLQKYRPYSDSIDLITKDNLYPNRETNLNKYNQEEFMFGYYSIEAVRVGAYIPTVLRVGVNVLKYNNSNPPDWITYCASTNVNSNSIHNIHLNKVTDNKYSFEYNGTTFNDRTTVLEFPSNYEIQGFLYLFNINNPTNAKQYFNGAFNTYIHYRDNIAIQNLIPCKLLKSVPKWLDANGIRRQTGECGMIDLVSGKFYGNVNSVGTFTVENYYERKEWLVTENSNGDLMMSLPLNTNDFLLKRRILELDGNCYHFLDGQNFALQYFTSTTRVLNVYENGVNTFSSIAQTSFGDDIEIKSTNDSLTFNGEAVPIPDSYFTYLRFKKSVAGTIMKMSTSSITVDGSVRYVPCTLTMDLPASMDANNIARTKGTSGMWDLVSDRFYGNVANSGTFKAVNLAEGVDYEVHQWLVGDGSAYINTLITSYSGIIKVAFKSGASTNCAIFGREATKSDFTDRIVLLRYPYAGVSLSALYGTSTTRHYDLATDLNDEEITIDLDNQIMTNKSGNSIQINIGVNVTGSSVILFGKGYGESVVNGIAPSDVAIKKFFVSDQINLVPVKLLKSIPSKYDANGIARQAGECGMYDTVNDVFYGNVASSGSFTVSDDN